MHDLYGQQAGRGNLAMGYAGVEKTRQKNKGTFNLLCVLSQANVGKPKEVYNFYKRSGR